MRRAYSVTLEARVAVVHLAAAGLAVVTLTLLGAARRALAESLVARAETGSSGCIAGWQVSVRLILAERQTPSSRMERGTQEDMIRGASLRETGRGSVKGLVRKS